MKKVIALSLMVIVGILFASEIKRGSLGLAILLDSSGLSRYSLLERFYDTPAVKTVAIPGRKHAISADLYLPRSKGRHFPVLLVHGPDPDGKKEEHVARLAGNLARAGFLVLVPELTGIKNLRLELPDAEDVLASYLYITGSEHAAQGGGLLGISYGAGPMLLAAADPRIRDSIDFVATFGGYYDLRNVFLFGITGDFDYGGNRGFLRPQEAVRWMLAYRNLDLLGNGSDRETFRRIIEHRNRYENAKGAALAKSLGPEARRVYDFLINSDQDRFPLLYEALPLAIRERAYQMSPARAVKYIKAAFFIAHATDDYTVPYTESLRLADAVRDPDRVRAALLPHFLYGERESSSIAGYYTRYAVGGWRLFQLVYAMLELSGR